MYKEGYDIGLAPMKNDLFHKSKTNNKFREYSACWIAGIYSDVDIYSNCVVDGKTGLLVSNEDGSWYQALTRLLSDANLRQSIQNSARNSVEQEYALDNFASILLEDINQVLSTGFQPVSTENNSIQVTDSLKSYQKATPISWRIIQIPLLTLQKIYKSIKSYGLVITFRLMLDQLERYLTYFEISRHIYRKKI
jgi:hypothetical protein